jgi:hypothetical protein
MAPLRRSPGAFAAANICRLLATPRGKPADVCAAGPKGAGPARE